MKVKGRLHHLTLVMTFKVMYYIIILSYSQKQKAVCICVGQKDVLVHIYLIVSVHSFFVFSDSICGYNETYFLNLSDMSCLFIT